MIDARHRHVAAKRALVCAPHVPQFDKDSGGQSIYDIVMFLRDGGWAVTYVAQDPTPDVARYETILRRHGVATYVGSHWLTEEFVAHSRFDLAVFAFWYVAEKFAPIVRRASPATKIAVNTMDLHFLRNARRVFHETAQAAAQEDVGPRLCRGNDP